MGHPAAEQFSVSEFLALLISELLLRPPKSKANLVVEYVAQCQPHGVATTRLPIGAAHLLFDIIYIMRSFNCGS